MPFFAHNSKSKRGELSSSVSSSSSFASSNLQFSLAASSSAAPPVPIKDSHHRLPRFSSSPSFAVQRQAPCTPPRKNSADSSFAGHTSSSFSSSFSSSPDPRHTRTSDRAPAPLALKSHDPPSIPQRSLLLSLHSSSEISTEDDVTQQQPLAKFDVSGDVDIMLSSSTSADDFDDLDIDLKRVVSKNPLTGAPVVRYRLRLRHRHDRSNSSPSRICLPVPPFAGSPTPSPLARSFKTRSKHTSAPIRHLTNSLERSSLDRIPSSSSSPRLSNTSSDYPSPLSDPPILPNHAPSLFSSRDEYESSSASITEPPDTPQGLHIPFSSMFPIVHTSANYISTRDKELTKGSIGLSVSDKTIDFNSLPSPDRNIQFESQSTLIEDDGDADIESNICASEYLKESSSSSSAMSYDADKDVESSSSSNVVIQFKNVNWPPRRKDSFVSPNRRASSSKKSHSKEMPPGHIRLTASHWSETDDDD